MKKDTFEDYLQEKHAEQYQGLDDEIGEDFVDWLENLDVNTLVTYGEIYGMERFNAGMKEVTDKI